MKWIKGKRASKLTGLEVTLIVLCVLITAVCIGVVVVVWAVIKENRGDNLETNEISGKMKIVGGASYSPQLRDPTSTDFKILAFDVERVINKVYSKSSMKNNYAGCRVVAFEKGSVLVLLGLKFRKPVSEGLVQDAKKSLLKAIIPSTPSSALGSLPPFNVDIASVQVDGGKPSIPTFKPTLAPTKTSIPTFKPTLAPTKTSKPTFKPTLAPTKTSIPTFKPTLPPNKTSIPTFKPTLPPTKTSIPTLIPTKIPMQTSTTIVHSTSAIITPNESCGFVELWEPNTTFSTPNYPNNYNINTVCVWLLRTRDHNNLQLHFQDFDTELGNDQVMIYDGNSTRATLIGMFSGNESWGDVFSSSSALTVRFSSDHVTNRRGFRANFTSGYRLGMSKLCSDDLFQCENQECVWHPKVCDGRPDCTDESDEKGCARLLNSTAVASGVLQLYVEQQWHSLCTNDTFEELAMNTCVNLGYLGLNSSELVAAVGYGPYVHNVITTNTSSLNSTSCEAGSVLYVKCVPKACGRRPQQLEPQDRVVNGSDAAQGAWPWMVDLRFRDQHLCGASLMSADWILTAAHCVRGRDAAHLTAAFGLHSQLNMSSVVEQRSVSHVHMHLRYNHYTKDNDIALLRLASPVYYTDEIQPVCLTKRRNQFSPGMLCYIAGWGRINNAGDLADVLQEAAVPLVPQMKCEMDWHGVFRITDKMVCAGYAEGNIDACNGDSGGPLMCEENGHWHLVGITSFGDFMCGMPDRAGVYTRVQQYLDWISGIVDGNRGIGL